MKRIPSSAIAAVLALAGAAAANPGDTLWTIEIVHPYARPTGSPTVAPDGTLYWTCRGLRAITPQGQELWHRWTIGDSPSSLGADGSIYTVDYVDIGTPDEPFYRAAVTKLSPDNQVLWQHLFEDHWAWLSAGPIVGPDGNVYGVVDGGYRTPGPAWSFTPDGGLRWESTERYYNSNCATNGLTGENGRLYIATEATSFGGFGGGGGGVYALDYDGNVLWSRQQSFTLLTPHILPAGGVAFGVLDTVVSMTLNNEILWTWVAPWSPTGLETLGADPETGEVYALYGIDDLVKLSPQGEVLWSAPAVITSGFASAPAISEDGSLVIFGTTGCIDNPDTACPGRVIAVRASDGQVVWNRELPRIAGGPIEVVPTRPTFSPDGSTVYIAANARVAGHGFLFAMETGLSGSCAADFDGDGGLTLNDFVQFRNAYTTGDLRADFDGNGSLTLNDFVFFRNQYTAGCA